MATCKSCWCFRTLRTASAVGTTFTLVVSLMQGLVILAVFTSLDELARKGNGPDLFDDAMVKKVRDVGILYIVLACLDLIVVFFSIIALFGIEPRSPSRLYFYPWITFYPLYIIYESTINIYYWVEAFDARDYTPPMDDTTTQTYIFQYRSTRLGFLVVPIVYWAIKTILILVFWFIVIFFALEQNRERKALKASKQQLVEPVPTLQPAVIQCSGIHRATDPYLAINRGCQPCQAVSTPLYRATPNTGFQPGTYDRAGPSCAQGRCGYNPAGPYRIY